MEVEGSINGDAFFVFLNKCLGPCLRPGDVVLMDNLSTHKSARMSEAIQAHGAEVIFLPRYSPDFNPIEGLPAQSRRPHSQSPRPRSGAWLGAHQGRQRPWLVPTRGLLNLINLQATEKRFKYCRFACTIRAGENGQLRVEPKINVSDLTPAFDLERRELRHMAAKSGLRIISPSRHSDLDKPKFAVFLRFSQFRRTGACLLAGIRR